MNVALKTLLPVMTVTALLVAGNLVYGQAPAAPAPAVVPGLTLADDLKTVAAPLVPGYAAKHPRLLFAAEDVAALKKKAEAQPELWAGVLDSAKGVAAAPPAPDMVTSGRTYWRIERVESGALAYLVTGEKRYLDGAAAWMIAHAREPLWGNDYRPNLDLEASWYLYHIALAYDMLYNDLDPADRIIIRDGLARHAKAIYDSFDPATRKRSFPFDQNHTYIPATALTTAALALLGDVPEAQAWLNRAYAVMRRCRYALGEDGYYYEGCGYWSYALQWHVRYADLISRATGEKAFDLPVLRDSWKFALYLSLPGAPYEFDIGDVGRWTGTQRPALLPNSFAMLWGEAAVLRSGPARATGDLYQARKAEHGYPAAAFLWFDATVPPTPLEEIKPYFHFSDHDVVAWRSDWGEDATCCLFRCGPPEGHLALAKLAQMKDWTMDPGHVHADIGSFWLYAKKAYLATGTGYTSLKWTRDQNTLLVDGQGQATDGSYWNALGFPYEKLNQARIDRVHLADDYGFASGEFGAVYDRVAHDLSLRRSVLMTQRWLLVVDEMAAPAEHKLTWICHADGEFKPAGAAQVARVAKAGLAVLTLGGAATEPAMGPSTVDAGEGVNEKLPVVRGYQLTLTMKQPAKAARLVNLLIPLGDREEPPEVKAASCDGDTISFALAWPTGQAETVQLDLKPFQPAAGAPGPAKITVK